MGLGPAGSAVRVVFRHQDPWDYLLSLGNAPCFGGMRCTRESCHASPRAPAQGLAVSTGELETTLAIFLSGGRNPSAARNCALEEGKKKGKKKTINKKTNEFSKTIFSSH